MKTMMIKNAEHTLAPSIDRLFPRFGEKGLDIPSWDVGKGMYLVDQYQAASGNRALTYVGVSEQLLIELTLGHFHSWEFVNRVRVMAYDGEDFRVICSHDWEQSTHYRREDVIPILIEALTEYVMASGCPDCKEKEQVSVEVTHILGDIFSKKAEDLDRKSLRLILASYCARKRICGDFIVNVDI